MVMKTCVDCGRAIPAGMTRCAQHYPIWKANDDARRAVRNRTAGYSSSHWQRLRRLALERDGYTCRFQLRGCTLVATTVDLNPAAGRDHRTAQLEDCLTSCPHCHGSIDGARSHQAKRARSQGEA